MKFAKFLLTPPVCAISAILLGVCAANAAVYLRADSPGGADGQTFDGTSWSTAYKTLKDALVEIDSDSCEDKILYVAKGIYTTGSIVSHTVTKILIYGGYKGETDGDMTRDPEEYQSFISGASDLTTRRWTHVVPSMTEDKATTSTSTECVVVDGKLNLPKTTGDYDTYYCGGSGYFLVIPVGGEVLADGLKFLCFGRQGWPGGSAIGVNTNAKRATINNCVFAGGSELQRSMLWIGGTAEPSTVTNCKFYYNKTGYSSNPHLCASSTTTVEDCEFVGAYDAGSGASDFMLSAGGVTRRCVFTHNLRTGGCTGIAVGDGTIVDCVITNNMISGNSGSILSVGSAKQGLAADLLIANNRLQIFNAADLTPYYLVGMRSCDNYISPVYDNILIASNTLEVVTVAAASGSYALGMLGGRATKNNRSIATIALNCTFDGNTVTWPEKEGVVVTASRGLLYADLPGSGQSGTSVAVYATNCTFMAQHVPNVYDVAQYGTDDTKPLRIANSIFMVNGADVHANAFLMGVPALLKATDCTIKNLLSDYLPADYDIAEGLYTDEIPFERIPCVIAGADTGYAYLRPAAKTPGIRETTDGSVRGAVDELSEPAENGHTLTIRRSPFTSGTVDIPVQAVADGAAISPVTATPIAGGGFSRWINEADGSTYSTDNPLVIASLTEDLVLTADFEKRQVKVAFDLKGAGTFIENGASRIELEASGGETFPAIPEYTLGENNYIYRWDDMPGTVPNEDSEYCAHWVTKDLRIVYVTKEGAGAKDGTSWANAYDDISAAYADAGHYRGEVWIAGGVYTQALPIVKCAAVNVRGGFAGTEASASEADPAAHPTVITGCGTTYYAVTDTDYAAGDAEFSGLTFADFYRSAIHFASADVGAVRVSRCNFVNCNGSAASDYPTVLVLGSVAFSDCAFTNCRAAIKATCSAVVTNVIARSDFYATTGMCARVVLGVRGAGLAVRDCTFRKGYASGSDCAGPSCGIGAASTYGDFMVSNCLFEGNVTADAHGCVCVDEDSKNGDGAFLLERCRFVRNGYLHLNKSGTTGRHNVVYSTPCVYLAGTHVSTLVRDCYFKDNFGTNYAGRTASCIQAAGGGYQTALNCTFEGNGIASLKDTDKEKAVYDSGYAATVASRNDNNGNSQISLVNCSFIGSRNTSETPGRAHEVANISTKTTYVLNSILWNEAEDYAPLYAAASAPLTVGRCVIRNFDPSSLLTTSFVQLGFVRDADPLFAESSEVGPNGVIARPIGARSSGARGGFPVWIAENEVCIYDSEGETDHHWLNVSRRTYAADATPPYGLSLGTPLVSDAWDQTRRRSRVSLGALQGPPPGLMLLVR